MYEECHLTLVSIRFPYKIIPAGHVYRISVSWFQQVLINSISFVLLCTLSSNMTKRKIRLLHRMSCTDLLAGVSNLYCWKCSSLSKFNFKSLFNFKLLFRLFCFRNSLIRTSTQTHMSKVKLISIKIFFIPIYGFAYRWVMGRRDICL